MVHSCRIYATGIAFVHLFLCLSSVICLIVILGWFPQYNALDPNLKYLEDIHKRPWLYHLLLAGCIFGVFAAVCLLFAIQTNYWACLVPWFVFSVIFTFVYACLLVVKVVGFLGGEEDISGVGLLLLLLVAIIPIVEFSVMINFCLIVQKKSSGRTATGQS